MGDEFDNGAGRKFVVLKVCDDGEIDRYVDENGTTYHMEVKYRNMKKTGRHFPQVAELLEAMKGEQRNCSTCKHDNDGLGKICRRCAGYEKWEPKGKQPTCETCRHKGEDRGYCEECDSSLSEWEPKGGAE